jgi:hypothetical protein
MILSTYKSLVRLSDSHVYTVEDLDYILKYVKNLTGNMNVIYVNYKPRHMIQYDKVDNSIHVYILQSNENSFTTSDD